MKLYEYQGKSLFVAYGIPTPRGVLVLGERELAEQVSLFEGDVVLKAQVPVGGRGKAGAVVRCSVERAVEVGRRLFGMEVGGFAVRRLLVEEAVPVEAEWYVSVVFERSLGCPVVLAGRRGGVDVERVALEHPEAVFRVVVDPLFGLLDFQVRRMVKFLCGSVRGGVATSVSSVIRGLYRLFTDFDCLLAEINPLAFTGERVVALDAKVIVDDNALYRQERIAGMRDEVERDPIEVEAKRAGMSYVALEGDIGCVVNGAGLAMATMDLITHFGGKPANFLDVRAGASSSQVVKAVKLLSLNEHLRCIFVNIFGGITRCDEIARGLLEVIGSLSVPLIVRLTGTRAKEGLSLLARADVITATSTEEGVRKAVML
jgi:succinyl-CoA synthetase beta subunit